MSVTSLATKITYVGDNTTTIFAVPYYFINQTDLMVQGLRSDGVLFNFNLNGDYLISGVPNLFGDYPSGANVVFNIAPPLNMRLLIQRITQRTQIVGFLNFAPITADTLNHTLDKLTLLMQEGLVDGYLGVSLGPPTIGLPTYQIGNWFKNGNPVPGSVFGWILTTDNVWNSFGLISLSS